MAKSKFIFQKIMEDFLKLMGWEDDLELDEKSKFVRLRTNVGFGDYRGGLLVVEASDQTQIVSVFFYLPFECSESKRIEMVQLLNELNQRGYGLGGYGCFQLLETGDDRIRWVHRVDFEGSSPTALSIRQIVGPGWNRIEELLEIIRLVALTKETAVGAIKLLESE